MNLNSWPDLPKEVEGLRTLDWTSTNISEIQDVSEAIIVVSYRHYRLFLPTFLNFILDRIDMEGIGNIIELLLNPLIECEFSKLADLRLNTEEKAIVRDALSRISESAFPLDHLTLVRDFDEVNGQCD